MFPTKTLLFRLYSSALPFFRGWLLRPSPYLLAYDSLICSDFLFLAQFFHAFAGIDII